MMHLYVIKYNNDTYWCGYNKYDKQLRKAKIYTSKPIAEKVAEDSISRLNYIAQRAGQTEFLIESFRIVEVDLKEIE